MSPTVPSRPEDAFVGGADLAALRRCPSVDEAFSRMLYLVEQQRPLGVVYGPAGCGKSDLLEMLRRSLPAQSLLVDMATLDSDLFGWTLAAELGLAPSWTQPAPQIWKRVEDHLQGQADSGRPVTLLLDRLDMADSRTLRCVERLIVAQPGGLTVLATAQSPLHLNLLRLLQRYADVRIELGPLSLEEVRLYLQGAIDGRKLPAFDESAISAMHARTGGVLREIRRCALLALLAAETEAQTVIRDKLVSLAAAELPTLASASEPADLMLS